MIVLILAAYTQGGDDAPQGARPLTGKWTINFDPERSLELTLDGYFTARSDPSRAPAGQTDILIETSGTVLVSNLSTDRDFDAPLLNDTGLQLFLPIKSCPDWGDLEAQLGSYCTRDVASFDLPDLAAGAQRAVTIDKLNKVATVPEEQAVSIVEAILGEEGVIVSADRVFANGYLEKANPTCTFIRNGDEGSWITYFTEDPNVDACSTEMK